MTAPSRQTAGSTLRLAEIASALSLALDATDGQPAGHSLRCCWIGMHIGREIGLSEAALFDLFYALLFKDLGCSSNAARICQLFVTSDQDFKRNAKLMDSSLPQVLSFVVRNTAVKSGLAERLRTLLTVALQGGKIDHELIETRCHRGADIARQMRFGEPVATAILDLDEHWNGGGQPQGLKGEAISLLARIALLAQVVDVFHTTSGAAAARREIERRSGNWFDPSLVAAFLRFARRPDFWEPLVEAGLEERVYALEPASRAPVVDEALLDDMTEAFARVIDAKTPFTSGHSRRVAEVADLVAEELGVPPTERRWLVRAALLHDIGKLGVSNEILDKPSRLDPAELRLMQGHTLLGESILSRVAAFSRLASIAGAHHEKLDGSGYPRGLKGSEISLETRIVTVADIFDAMTADRPYRAAMPVSAALAVMATDAGLDFSCFAALRRVVDRLDGVLRAGAAAPKSEPATLPTQIAADVALSAASA